METPKSSTGLGPDVWAPSGSSCVRALCCGEGEGRRRSVRGSGVCRCPGVLPLRLSGLVRVLPLVLGGPEEYGGVIFFTPDPV